MICQSFPFRGLLKDSNSILMRILSLWFLVSIFSLASSLDYIGLDNPSILYTYTRTSELQNQCGSILSSASELEPDDNRGGRIKTELFFVNGDWNQEPAAAGGLSPLMPFNDVTRGSYNYFGHGAPKKLVSFWVVDVNPVRQVKDAVSISAVMEIGITSSGSMSHKPYKWSPGFYKYDGVSRMTVLFEGIYVESNDNGGQQSMCLLGNAVKPTLNDQNADFTSELENRYGRDHDHQSTLVSDDQILLVLHYPKTFSLTRRAILGELRSLNDKWNLTYFDEVHISSSSEVHSSRYEFGSGGSLLASACSPYPYRDELVYDDGQVEMFKGDGYCEMLQDFVWNEAFRLVPNWKFIGSKDYNLKLGSFLFGGKIEESDSIFERFRLLIKDFRCELGDDENGTKSTKVSAIFRAIEAKEYQFREEETTGVSGGATFSAEGTFRSSHGQLCMVGCQGLLLGSPAATRCNTRICLYLPLVFSITQRNIAFGTISSINGTGESISLAFEKDSNAGKILAYYQWKRHTDWSYNYTKMTQATEFRTRSKPSKLGTFLRKSFLRYPSLKGNHVANFSSLSDLLSVKVCSVPLTLSNARMSKIYAEIDVLSLGSLFGRNWSRPSQDVSFQEQANSSTDAIKISGQISITGREFFNISLFLEGLYDPVIGEMYLIGCRDVRALTAELSYNNTNLEQGMDCEIEVKVMYPPRNARWLLNPNVRISINSKRSKNDPLHFGRISLRTFLLSYEKKADDVLFRRVFEEILRVLLLVAAILSTLSQIRYTRKVGHGHSPAAYTSIVMLSAHALSYSIPLITGDEVLFKWKVFSQSYDNSQRWEVLDSFVKTLLVVALMMTLKLSQKVWESRGEQLGHSLATRSTPDEKPVILISFAIHALGFFTFRVCHSYASQTSGNLLQDLGVYAGIAQDLFLIPQIVGIVVWRIQGKVKPLRKLYYWGFTAIRLVIHVYDYVTDPIPSPQQDDSEFEYLGRPEFYAKLGHVVIAAISITLAVTVYIQQRCSNKSQQFVRARKLDECEEDPSPGAGVYQKLLSE